MDGNLLVNIDGLMFSHEETATVALTTGRHEISLEYHFNTQVESHMGAAVAVASSGALRISHLTRAAHQRTASTPQR